MSGPADASPPVWRDVTRALSDGHPVWPGDTPFRIERTSRLEDGDSVNLTRLTGTTHLGTHVDAPWHYDPSGARIESVPLDVLIGACEVLDVREGDGPVVPSELPDRDLPPRVLLRTGQPDAWTAFPTTIRPIAPATVDRLAARGVRLLGTDAPSVDPLDDRELPAHHACGRAGITIVEGLALADVAAGAYELACLPLALVGTDAAPARVALRAGAADGGAS